MILQRPVAKANRSDSSLPRLARATSITSNTSSQPSGRPRMKEKDSENSVVVVDDEGHEVEEEDAEDGDWDDEESPVRTKDSKDKDPMSAAMRRTLSESVAARRTQSPEEIGVQPASITSPVSVKKSLADPPALMTRKTTGFSGALHPAPEPEPETVEMPPLKRVQSVKELAAQAIEGERQITARKLAMMDQQSHQAANDEVGDRPGEPTRSRSTQGSGLPKGAELTDEQKHQIQTSPSFPFPRVLGQEAAESSQMAQRSVSGAAPRLRQRSSNASLRSTASYRAPPHPLNTQPPLRTTPHSRSGSTAVSPDEFDIRRSMHHPPIAPPVINTESAEGHTWDIPEDREPTASAIRPPPPVSRRDSTTSQRSLRAIFQPTSTRIQATASAGPSSSGQQSRELTQQHSLNPSRRMTALEAAAAAAKLHTTTNPALYHQSLGHSPSAAETAHLISRFLPPKKSTKPRWNITPEMMQDGHPHLGLTEGDYREAHDSLIRQMRDLNLTSSSASRRQQDRRVSRPPTGSYLALATPTVRNGWDTNVGIIKTRNGPLTVSRGGGWRGKTPFELGVERCLAQRPKAAGWGQ